MKAVVQSRYGSPDDLEVRDVEIPAVADDEVLVRVRAASLHPDVWHVVCGRPWVLRLFGAGFLRPVNPIPGTDMAGIVESAGGRASRFKPGDAVFGETPRSHGWTNGGAFAEFVAVREALLAAKPDNVTFEQAASVPASGFIALLNLRGASHDWRGRRVLINGAGGGVGTIALQVAKACGAHVTAVDGPAKLEFVRALGADEVIDYTQEEFTRRGARYDLIFDVPGIRRLADFRPALAAGGRYVPIGHEGFGAVGRRVFGLVPHFLGMMLIRAQFTKELRGPKGPPPTREQTIVTLRDLLAAGVLTPVIAGTYPLSGIREAFRHMIEGNPLGKVIVTPSDET